ncbi:hypothetical protein ABZ477_13635 [Microbacterium sp. NPDC019599]|uniref:hypothetical protein n=1 Tax=Microbacterium sp. NPDC019599 TaxID=3154690 RepID=UPI0033E5F1C4
MALAHVLVEDAELLEIVVAVVLVAESDVSQLERLGVSGFRAQRSPRVGRGIAGGPIDQVLDVLAELSELGTGGIETLLAAELAADPRGDDRHRGDAEVLAQQEVLVEPDLMRLAVVAVGSAQRPEVEVRHARVQRPDGLLPVVRVSVADAFDHAAAREAHEGGVQVPECLDQVPAEPALRPLRIAGAPVIGVNERDFVDVDVSGARQVEPKQRTRVPGRPDQCLDPMPPLVARQRDLDGLDHLAVSDEADLQHPVERLRSHPRGEDRRGFRSRRYRRDRPRSVRLVSVVLDLRVRARRGQSRICAAVAQGAFGARLELARAEVPVAGLVEHATRVALEGHRISSLCRRRFR